MIITPADRVMEIREGQKLGIGAEIQTIDFEAILERMRRLRAEQLDERREAIGHMENLDFYRIEAHSGPSPTWQILTRGKTPNRRFRLAYKVAWVGEGWHLVGQGARTTPSGSRRLHG